MATYASSFQDCQNEVIDKLRLDSTADLTRVKEWLNQTLLNVAATTGYFSGSSSGTALAAAASSQALPAAIIELEYATCTYGGQTVMMTPVNYDQILMRRSSPSSGPPQVFSLRKGTVEFWPSAAGGEVLTYYGATYPEEMTANSDVTGLPEPFATKLVVYGACVEAADFKNDQRLGYYQQVYAQWMNNFQAFLNQRISESSRAFPVYGPDGRPFGAPFLPHDPSSDFYVTGWR